MKTRPERVESYYKCRERILEVLDESKNIIFFFDTETTGTEPFGDPRSQMKRDRLIELGVIAYYYKNDFEIEELKLSNGDPVIFHEFVNPFIEPMSEIIAFNSKTEMGESEEVHGISIEFLNGVGQLKTGDKIPEAAETFDKVMPLFEIFTAMHEYSDKLGSVIFSAHNATFDKKVMNSEIEKYYRFSTDKNYHSDFESFFSCIDTLPLSRQLLTKSDLEKRSDGFNVINGFGNKVNVGYNLDYLQHYYKVEVDRTLHGALIDSKILADVYKGMISSSEYMSAPNVPNMQIKSNEVSEFLESKINSVFNPDKISKLRRISI
jgi:DNA polymerase III epsilon subunit-like protein